MRSKAEVAKRNHLLGDPILDAYLRDLERHPRLSAEKSHELARALEGAEIEHWVALLSLAGAAKPILAHLDEQLGRRLADLEPRRNIPKVEALRQRAEHAANLVSLARSLGDQALLTGESMLHADMARDVARAVRPIDDGRLWMRRAHRIAHDCVPEWDRSERLREYIARVDRTDAERASLHRSFVNSNLRFVVFLAKRCYVASLLDAIQDGNIGLMKAVDRYEPSIGSFLAFATHCIKGEINQATSRVPRDVVRVPAGLRRACRAYDISVAKAMTLTGKEPTPEEIEQRTGLARVQIEWARSLAAGACRTVSINAPLGGDETGGKRLGDMLHEEDAVHVADVISAQQDAAEIERVLTSLTDEEASLIRLRFGFDGEQELTLDEVGERYGISGERARLIQKMALNKIRLRINRDTLRDRMRAMAVEDGFTGATIQRPDTTVHASLDGVDWHWWGAYGDDDPAAAGEGIGA